ncbi:ABC transporter ATP-binding protein [Haloferax sulfurifontis]|uniref:Peptide ABC transporter ATP-binding protein n=1 Tax=Haloferax sulfurifontis ATCC BAA-897 TaxID=662480 RepID=M0IKE6_9EURY|nr:ABC transporter ATP-binding protein [Haloferax sulfurifontis]ELZ96328.1 peptide ABC transporter ATP-binding protein [Haloferax sulfurifontis ATCC BAA-897]
MRTSNQNDSNPDQDVVFEVRDLEVTFGTNRGESRVVRNVDFDIYRNETLGMVGESGSGKSMTSSALMNAVVSPGETSGEVTYYPPDGGEPISVLDLDEEELRKFRWGEVAMVFQGAMSSFNPVKKVRGHFRETLEDHNRDVEAGLERAHQILGDLYLDPDRVLDSYPYELSGGMKQRALVALALILEPEVLVMDEPTAALDLLMQRSIVSLLKELKEEYELTIIFITHDLPLLTKLADRLVVMYAFDIVEVGSTEEILYDAAHPYTRSLLNATPDLNAPIEEMQSISGSKPDPVTNIPGCSYRPRCPMADESCAEAEPPMADRGNGHRTACFYHDDVSDEIPIPAMEAAEEGGEGE